MSLLLASLAFASAVAVLPLEQGAGGQVYEGLGKALAGMLVTDLSQAPGITLVERARLDALLAEITLSSSGYLDEASAQKLGRGVGAEFVVTGSYSVVAGQFLLDARLVGVESAKVVRAADAHGPVDTFVDVEKTLVTALLDGLAVTLAEDARQRLLATTPTHDFDAFASYGEGLARQDEGKLDEAREAFGEALAADPGFKDAATALGGLRQTIDRLQSDKLRKDRKARSDLLDKVLARFPDERTVAAGAPVDREALAGFGLRLLALQEQGRDCQRYEEMRHYLDRVGWNVAYPKGGYAKLVEDAHAEAIAIGLSPEEKADPQGHRSVQFQIQTDMAMIFGSTARFFYNYPDMLLTVPRSPDLLTTMTRCLSAPEQVAELAALRAGVEEHGVGTQSVWDYKVPLSERLVWSGMAIRARSIGVDAAMRKDIEARIAAWESDETTHTWLLSQAQQVVMFGEAVERARVQSLGFRDREIAPLVTALAAADAEVLALDVPLCASLVEHLAPTAKALAGRVYPGLSAQLAPVRDFGCLRGTPGRFATPADAYLWIATAAARARPENAVRCRDAFVNLPSMARPTTWPGMTPAQEIGQAASALNRYYGELVFPMCVSEE